MRFDEALKTLAGSARTLVVDPVHRLVSFELRTPYDGLVQTSNPTVPSAPDPALVSAVLEPVTGRNSVSVLRRMETGGDSNAPG